MIKYYVGVNDYNNKTVDETFHRTLKDGIDECPRHGFDSLEEAMEERLTLLNEGYLIVKVFKVEEM
jgi:hypothetical protein